MSDLPAPVDIDLRATLAQIDRAQAETRKFAAEQNRLAEEASKYAAEAKKLERDRWIPPLTLAVAVLAAILAALPTIRSLLGT